MTSEFFILDGGLGTTLEDVFKKNISSSLWSARPIVDDPEVIISAHLAFLRAGADVILTSTYQCASNTFEQSGFSREDARRIMLKSVTLATEAKRRFLVERSQQSRNSGEPHPSRRIRIALSLGPYGATLSPAHEYDGFYPPPFGPDRVSERTNAFEDNVDGHGMERIAIDALEAFHYERLSLFAEDEATWAAIDFVAFETVPLRREVVAIRRAVARLQENKLTLERKLWWISTVYPDGRFPELKSSGGRAGTSLVAAAVLLGEEGAVPTGFGINCTGVEFLPGLLQDVLCVATRARELHGKRPWLVLYPNRGDIYDPQTQTWRTTGKEETEWAEELNAIVDKAGKTGIWDSIIVGGCCKASPKEIESLSSRFKLLAS